MKFIHYLKNIEGVGFYPMASLLIFTIFFTVAAIWALRTDKRLVEHISRIPLDQDETPNA